jgi:uncharacterized iron-regulated protein
MRKFFITAVLFFLTAKAMSQHKPAYVLYNAEGKKVSYAQMIKSLTQQDIVMIGEFHNNPISHWMQLEITRDCHQQRKLVLGAEMFEQDNQTALDLYLKGTITAKGLDSAARLWNNYKTDYAPLVNYAKANDIAFAATNIPRRYASLISKAGFEVLDTLTSLEKSWMAPLPMAFDSTLPGYQNMMTMMAGHGSMNMVRAQASKDATMAHFILKYFIPGSLFIHYNGSYHSDNHDGIVWYLRQGQPNLKIATVTTVSQAVITTLSAENKHKADFIICVDEDMTTTY